VGADVKQLSTPLNLFCWTNTPGTRRLKGQFDGGWLSLRSKNRTKRTETLDPHGIHRHSERGVGWAGRPAELAYSLVAPDGVPATAIGNTPVATRTGADHMMVGYNLVFWLLMVAIVTLLVLVATSFEGMHLETTGGPGRIL
jgi:hypothetical protein